MKIKDIAFHDRPSERLIKYGAGVLSDYELLAIVLGKGFGLDNFTTFRKLN